MPQGKHKYSDAERLTAAAGIGAFVTGSGLVAWLDPSKNSIFPGCPLLDTTGFACPGCGLTRGFHALFHGDFITALDFNILVPIFAVGFIYLLALLSSIAVRGRSLGITILTPAVLWTFLVVAIVFGVLRNIPLYPFELLFP